MNSSKIILTSSCDWRPWLFIIITMAIGGDIWQYLNPDLDISQPEPIRPSPPQISDASSDRTHTTLASLITDEREIYKLLYSKYKEDLSIFDKNLIPLSY